MKKIISVSLFFACFFLLACTSFFKRQDCNKINWFDYGYQIAMKGQRLTGDAMITECRKVEAEVSDSQLDLGFKSGMSQYCKPEIVYSTGKNGQYFSEDLCDPSSLRSLRQEHKKGVSEFCQASGGYDFGTTGGVYNKICPANLEAAFLVEYKKGRKKYLDTMVKESDSRIFDLEKEIKASEGRINQLSYSLMTEESRVTMIPANDPKRAFERQNAENSVQKVKNEISSERSNFSNKKQKIEQIKEQKYNYQRELNSLAN